MAWASGGSSGVFARSFVVLLAIAAATLGFSGQAGATSLTAGDVVVERDGNGGAEALTSSATPVYLNEYEPVGGLAATLPLPTTTSGSNHRLLDSGSATSDGQLTLSGNGECLLTVGYDADRRPASVKVTKTKAAQHPRVVALVDAQRGNQHHDGAHELRQRKQRPQCRRGRMQSGRHLRRRRRHQNHRRGGRGGTRQIDGHPAQRSRPRRPPSGGRGRPALRLGRSHDRRESGDRHRRQRASDRQRHGFHEPAVRSPHPNSPTPTACSRSGRQPEHARHALRRRPETGGTPWSSTG